VQRVITTATIIPMNPTTFACDMITLPAIMRTTPKGTMRKALCH
jgi:hypothetical protein